MMSIDDAAEHCLAALPKETLPLIQYFAVRDRIKLALVERMMEPVKSTNVKAWGYDHIGGVFYVEWLSSRKISAYSKVDQDTAIEVLTGDSPGKAVRNLLIPGHDHHYMIGAEDRSK